MDRDLRETPLYREIEAFARSILEPGFGRVSSASGPAPSPDGRWIAFRGGRLDRLEGDEHGRICLAEADGSGWRQVTDGPNQDTDPHWSPDGSRLSFLSDREKEGAFQLYLLEADRPAEARRLGELPGSAEWHRWSADGDRILIGVAGEAAEQADALGSGTIGGGEEALPRWIPEIESSDLGEGERRGVWLVDVVTGAAARASAPELNVWEASWCGPGHAAAIVSTGAGEDAWYGAWLSLVDLGTGSQRRLYRGDAQLGWAEAAPGGGTIAVIESICSDRVVVCGDLLVVEVASGEVRRLDLEGVDVSWTRFLDDTRLLAFGRRGQIQVVLEVELETGLATERWSTEERIGGAYHPNGTPTAEGFVTVVESHRRPPAVVEMRGGQERVLADLRHPGHDVAAAALARREPRRWTSSDRLEIEGYLSLPHGDPPFPLALHVHGGPVGSVDDTFPGLLTALLLRRGFAILDPNPRGSTGRGQAFIAGVVGDMGGMDLVDDLAGVDALVAEGIADPERLVLFGGSYGGFMSAWIPTQDPRFKAAVAVSPITDWWSGRFDSSLGAWVGDFLGGDPDAIPQEYTARSPVLQAHRCRTPVLLTAGRNDRATPVGQAVEFYRALRERGVASEVVKYPEEGHGVSNFPAVLDLLTRTVAWFERFLPPSDGGPHPGLRRD